MKLEIILIWYTVFPQTPTDSDFQMSRHKLLYCPFTDWLVGSNYSEQYRLEYVTVGENLKISCCQKFAVKNIAKNFYKRSRFFTDEEKPLHRNREELAWYINDIQEKQTGAYYCKDEFSTINAFTYFYLIDVEYPNATTIRGHIDAFYDYKKTYLDPLDAYLKDSSDPDIVTLQQMTGLGLTVEMRWDPWTTCDFCTGAKTRRGRCHLRPYVVDAKLCVGLCQMYKYTLHVDCRSRWTLEQMFPRLANAANDIPYFTAEAKCVGPCLTDLGPASDYTKQMKTRVINVGDSAVLSCPGFARKKKCYWRYNGAKLSSNEYDPFRKVSVNELCMLYLNDATRSESGNYTCYLEDKMIQQNRVIVEIAYSEMNKAWWRHVIYLLYVVLLCFIVIMGGVAIGCLQKQNFRKITVEEVIDMYATRRLEHERLLPPES